MKKKALVLFLIMSSFFSYSQNIGIGTTTPDSSSALEIKSTSQGFLPPRMTLIQRNQIQNPAQGLMIYCTDCGIDGGVQIYKGTEWQSLVSTSLFAYSANQLKQGLIAHYPFNGNANDVSINANNGSVSGATLTSDRFGLVNRAYQFDGIDDFISVPSSGPLNQLQGDFTVSFWTTSETNNTYQIMSKGQLIDSLNVFSFSGNFSFTLFSGPQLGIAFSNYLFFYNPGNLNNSPIAFNWNHFLLSKHQDIISFYINGTLMPLSLSYGDTIIPSDNYPLYIGKSLGLNHKGKIDDIYLYNRALTYEEIYYLSTH